MSVIERIVRLCRADLHKILDHLENRELLLKQYLREMACDLDQKRDQLAQINRDLCASRSAARRPAQEFTKLEHASDPALSHHREEIGRNLPSEHAALTQKREHLTETCTSLEVRQKELSELVEDQLRRYEIAEAAVAEFSKARPDSFSARAKRQRGEFSTVCVANKRTG